MSELFCNVDVTNPSNITQSTFKSDSDCALLNNTAAENHNDYDSCNQGPLFKKPRLREQQDTLCTLNGYKDTYNICNSESLPELEGEIKKVRLCFDSKLKLALKEKLSNYISCIETTEKAVANLKEEIKQLSYRMDFIESSSNDLTKLITDRIPLPTPTSVGQSRSLSSQAPRLPIPSHPPMVSAPEHRSGKLVNHALNNRQSNMTSSSSVSSKLLSVLPKALDIQHLSQTTPGTVLAIQVNDTIDLTSDANIENAWEEHLISGSTNSRQLNKRDTAPFSSLQNGIVSTINVQPSFTFNTSDLNNVDPKQSYFDLTSLSQVQVISTNQMVNSQINSLPSYSVFPDVQLLPVALLPPVPSQPLTSAHHLPLQPVPQLTIAEAAEGVCLQWSVTFPTEPFEPAVAYEIYSYASSEVTLLSVQTSLPWKKVGEVAALPLPMACTLTHVQANNMYYFIVRSVDRLRRYSAWSNVVNAYVS
ncbi:Activating transcription factor 7-interacting protein isoform 2 [Schistosoma japonicum]|uniref:Activating transcription factor 7-interacting protein isoform 2 n=2 Tax=Schistosoma japonicum TaxID=6182 RepID=A0A4Z2DPK8_SCHJA|nr:Activating transcription factor 7-interacting protein 1 [Schistosoma japonicum]KAH8862571.1 Activating transcription factor 7-interacting protein 1 [Schistosoma japonicum]KAH8862572.1 Activating transcription factor 7-interacting protein 1 [Schistosoma japonicum]KAH8862576.1 Activating transcription factor 7-interacting protein 1 [Schistosoma japonicum]KAH8862577.1 Activating transcription factor 7-interacting protein 1 [Schistosoma japonicum]